MTNFETLKQLPLKNFASMVFNIVTRDCKTETDFVAILEKEIPTELESIAKEALQVMQCYSTD